MAKEWGRFVKGFPTDPRVQEFEGTLEDYIEPLPPYVPAAEDPTLLRLVDKDKSRTVILLPVHEITGYLVIDLRTATHNDNQVHTTPTKGGTVRWSVHENCWVTLSDFNCSSKAFARVLERFALWLGYPPYVPCDNAVLFSLYERMAQKIQDVWLPTIDKKFVGTVLITVPEVLELTITVPDRSYYGRNEFRMRPLDDKDDMWPFSTMRAAGDQSFGEVKSDFKDLEEFQRSCSIPHRQRARMRRVLERFLAVGTPTIEYQPRT